MLSVNLVLPVKMGNVSVRTCAPMSTNQYAPQMVTPTGMSVR